MLAGLVVVCVAGAGLAVWAFWIEPSRLVVKRVTLEWVPEAGRGLRIALLSDLHVGSPHVGLERLASVVETVNRESPDLILLAGDFVVGVDAGEAVMEPHVFAPVLGKLRARLGVVAVLGNHDWWYLGGKVQRDLRAHGITVLHNQAVAYETGAGKLWIAGLGEIWVKLDDMGATLRDVPEGAPVILLTHNPDVFPTVPARVNLVLAGHTHGGQVKFPFIGAPVVPSQYGQRYAAGYIEENGRRMFVTTGVGTSILPVRFGVPPEIVIITLGETQNSERRTQNSELKNGDGDVAPIGFNPDRNTQSFDPPKKTTDRKEFLSRCLSAFSGQAKRSLRRCADRVLSKLSADRKNRARRASHGGERRPSASLTRRSG